MTHYDSKKLADIGDVIAALEREKNADVVKFYASGGASKAKAILHRLHRKQNPTDAGWRNVVNRVDALVAGH